MCYLYAGEDFRLIRLMDRNARLLRLFIFYLLARFAGKEEKLIGLMDVYHANTSSVRNCYYDNIITVRGRIIFLFFFDRTDVLKIKVDGSINPFFIIIELYSVFYAGLVVEFSRAIVVN